MNIHAGEPTFLSRITSVFPSIRCDHGEYRQYRHNQIRRLYGVSFGERLFIGLILMSDGVHEEQYTPSKEDKS